MSMLIIDVSNLAHRAFHTTGGLHFNGEPTGVLYGVLRDIDTFIDQFISDRCVFCFDSGGPGHRGEIYPLYKQNRNRDLTEEQQHAYAALKQQIARLGREILPEMGFRNILRVKGFEADDLIAYVADRAIEDTIIVSTDTDLFQCLSARVSCYSPTKKKLTTLDSFQREYKIPPVSWIQVKSIAGCATDNVAGVVGVGEKTAIKFIRNELNPSTKTYHRILDGTGIASRNMKLVRLPLDWDPPLKLPELRDDEVTMKKRLAVFEKLGIRRRARAS